MESNQVDMFESVQNFNYDMNTTCDFDVVPTAVDHIESLGIFGISLISVGSLLTTITLYLAVDASYNVLLQKESKSYKTNSLMVLSIYPIASMCSLLAAAIPRAQLLSEALTQISLTISLYRLYLLLIDLGRRNLTKQPSLALRVGPCCCWPCLPFPHLEMSRTNLAWLRSSVLQLPIIQGMVYCVFLFLSADQPILAKKYGVYLQPLSVTSILVGIYGLTITTKSLQYTSPEANLQQRTMVAQMVLLFSKLQCFIIKSLPSAGLFPCNPPLTPQTYANTTYNSLMLIEMFLLCYVARRLYMDRVKPEESVDKTNEPKNKSGPAEVRNNNGLTNMELPARIAAVTA